MRRDGSGGGCQYQCSAGHAHPLELHQRHLRDLEPIGSREDQRDLDQWEQRRRQRRLFQIKSVTRTRETAERVLEKAKLYMAVLVSLDKTDYVIQFRLTALVNRLAKQDDAATISYWPTTRFSEG